MAEERELAIVQFPHPGREWPPATPDGRRPWTDWHEGHARKFMRHRGRFLEDSALEREADLTFWGEWEGPSDCTPTGAAETGLPRWVHVPNRGTMPERNAQNTDPYVFGAFLYSNCMQDHIWPRGSQTYRPTAMSRLAPGSLILFGSTLAGSFVLDTCFVVGAAVRIDSENFLEQVAGRVPDAFVDATLRPIFQGVRDRLLTLYVGAPHAAHGAAGGRGHANLPPTRPEAGRRPEGRHQPA